MVGDCRLVFFANYALDISKANRFGILLLDNPKRACENKI